MSNLENEEMEQIDEDIDSVFDPEEWYLVREGGEEEEEGERNEDEDEDEDEDDDDDEDLQEDSESSDPEMLSPVVDVDDVCHKNRGFQLRSADHHMNTIYHFNSFPPQMRKTAEMEIKDVVKDYVLPFLPAKSLIRFRSVSMGWDRWIKSPFLAHQQSFRFQEISGFFCQFEEISPTFVTLNRHAYGVPTPSLSFLPEFVKIISSSNGLLLCQSQNENNTYYVCNPANNEWKELPKPQYYHGSEPAIVLAFEPSVLNMGAHYQLICALPSLDQPIVYFEMYSSRTNSWRPSDVICVELGKDIKLWKDLTFRDNGFYMNGMAYWETSSRKVLAFNPKKEIHGIISLPCDCPQGGVLTQMNEELCYIGISICSENDCFIEIYGGVDLSLKQKIQVHFELGLHQYRVLPCVDGNVVMIVNRGVLHSYSLRDQKLEVISREAGYFAARYLPYVNSLVCVA